MVPTRVACRARPCSPTCRGWPAVSGTSGASSCGSPHRLMRGRSSRLRPRPTGSSHGGRPSRLVGPRSRSALVRTRSGARRRTLHRDGSESTESRHPTTCPTPGGAGSPSSPVPSRRRSPIAASTCVAAIHGVDVTPEVADALELRDFDGSPLRRHFESERARYEWALRRSALPHDRARIRRARSPLARRTSRKHGSVGVMRDSATSCGPACNRPRCSTGRWSRSRHRSSISAGWCSSPSTSSARPSAEAFRASPASSPATRPSTRYEDAHGDQRGALRLVPLLHRSPRSDRVTAHDGPRSAFR